MPVRTSRMARLPRRPVVYLAAIAAICAIALSITARPSTASGRPGLTIRPAMLHRLTAMSLRGARLSGDPRPQWIDVVATSRDAALASAMHGDTVPRSAGQEVYLVVMKGNFVFADAAPPHGRPPHGPLHVGDPGHQNPADHGHRAEQQPARRGSAEFRARLQPDQKRQSPVEENSVRIVAVLAAATLAAGMAGLGVAAAPAGDPIVLSQTGHNLDCAWIAR